MKHTEQNREEWFKVALSVLIDKGPDALKIEPLCRLKGVSKGAFYHHFTNRAAFIDQLMTYWFNSMTSAFIEQANTQESPIERLEKLDTLIASHNIEAELHIRAWSLKDANIAQHLALIDQHRQAYLADCYQDLGLQATLAQELATSTYASFIGLQHIHPKLPIQRILEISTLASKAFIKNLNQPSE